MKLPFTHEQFLDLFGVYNRAFGPLILLIWLITVWVLVRLYRRAPNANRDLALVLAGQWAWSAMYHLLYFRRINPAAVAFGGLFLVEASLIAWRGVARGRLAFAPSATSWGRLGAALIVYSLMYPAVGLMFGLAYPRLPLYAVPCPTTIFTAGALLLLPRREARALALVPVVWSAIGGSAAVLLGIRADFVLALAGLILLVYIVSRPSR